LKTEHSHGEKKVAKILLVEDDVELSQIICDLLTGEHHTVEPTYDGRDALSRLVHYEYDVIVLDWELPGISGLEVLKQYRSKNGTTPVLMLTAKRDTAEKELGLDSGSDDYLTKPFNVRELSARVRALLRRPRPMQSSEFRIGDIVLDPVACRVTSQGREVALQRQEYLLLEFFMRNPNRVFALSS
jgi:DNA-binding response OmpR family regulator